MGSLTEDVRVILAGFRKLHDWQPGMVWDPYRAAYVWPSTYTACDTLDGDGGSGGGP